MNYLQEIAVRIRSHVPTAELPPENSDQLFATYAVLALALGQRVSDEDVHNAWVAWKVTSEPDHPSALPYSALDRSTARSDAPYRDAIRVTAREMRLGMFPSTEDPAKVAVLEALLPVGEPETERAQSEFLDLYKLMVASSEALVARRSGVNTFFLTLNGLLLTGMGLFLRDWSHLRFEAAGITALSLAGIVLCWAWRSLLASFGQLNTGKFVIIGEMEKRLAAAVYNAEWKALREGKDNRVYRSFTKREASVPATLFVAYLVFGVAALLVWTGMWQV